MRSSKRAAPRWKISTPAALPARATCRRSNACCEVFEVGDRKWRGIGEIPGSGYRLRAEYAAFDAEKPLRRRRRTRVDEPAECIAALVLQGLAKPVDCPAFGTRCTPETPLGAPMVSSEGACAAYYRLPAEPL